MKRQPTEWKKIFAKHVSGKGLISEMCKEFMQLNSKNKQTNKKQTKKPQTVQLKKWAKNLSRYFSKEDIQMASRYMRRCSSTLNIRKFKSKPQWIP